MLKYGLVPESGPGLMKAGITGVTLAFAGLGATGVSTAADCAAVAPGCCCCCQGPCCGYGCGCDCGCVCDCARRGPGAVPAVRSKSSG